MIDTNDLTPIDAIEDWSERIDRQDACFRGEIIDRPVVVMSCGKPDSKPFEARSHASQKERWYDVDFQVQRAKHDVENTLYFGDALPVTGPNLGPDYFPALFGGEIEFERTTSYIKPWLDNWKDWNETIRYDESCEYFLKLEELYDAFLTELKGLAYVGYPDIHTGSDCLAGFRGPMNLNFDTIEAPNEILKGLRFVTDQFYKTFDHYYDKLSAAGHPCTAWMGIVSRYKYHIPSSDFSYMISPNSFNELILDGLAEENRYFEANVHHLDGPGCRNHLDSILSIPELSMVQWVYGAGNGRASDYVDLYQKVQAAGKGVHMGIGVDELPVIMENLKPEGVWMSVSVSSQEQAETVLKQVSKWTKPMKL